MAKVAHITLTLEFEIMVMSPFFLAIFQPFLSVLIIE